MEIKIDISGIDEVKAMMNEKVVRQALRSTINKVQTTGYKRARDEVRNVFAINDRDLRQFVKVEKATGNKLEATIYIKAANAPVIMFGAKQTKRGVTVKIRKDRGRKLIKGAFIKRIYGEKVNVYKRKGKGRFPVRMIDTANPAVMFEHEGFKGFEMEVKGKAQRTFKHEFEFYMQRAISNGTAK